MMKKLLAFILATFMLFSFVSCFDGTTETTYSPETTEKAPEKPVLHSFYAHEVLYEQGYVILRPEEGSRETEKWTYIYLTNFTDGEPCPRPAEGTVVEVVYSGEIEKCPKVPFIPRITHAVTSKTYIL